MDCLTDGKPVLAGIENIECTNQELEAIYAGLKDMTYDTLYSQFKKELNFQISRIHHARNRILLQERWKSLTNEETVKSWCATHGAPLPWIVPRDFRKVISTVIDVQKNNRTLDQNVQNAILALNTMDTTILTDDRKIAEAPLDTKRDRNTILTKAKIKLGNDMSAWDTADLVTLQNILKKTLRDRARKEKYEQAKNK